MINLIAKSQPSGYYYYFEDGDDSVYLITPPFSESQKRIVDPLDVFLRKIEKTSLEPDSRTFDSFQDLYEFALNDPVVDVLGIDDSEPGFYDDIMIYEPYDSIVRYLDTIKEKIDSSDMYGIGTFILKLNKSSVIRGDASLRARLDDLYEQWKLTTFHRIVYPQYVSTAYNRLTSKRAPYMSEEVTL